MAANQKPVYATGYTSHGKVLARPGQRIDNVFPEHAVRGAVEGGVASDATTARDAAISAERDRRADVERQISTRSQKSEHTERRAGNIPQLVRMPDGSLAQITD